MSLDYDLYLETGSRSDVVLELLVAVANYTSGQEGSDTVLRKPGLHVSAWTPGELNRAMIRDSFGFEARLAVAFQVSKDDAASATEIAFRDAAALAARLPGDAALVHEGDAAVLALRGGVLVLDHLSGLWTDEWLERFPEPYRLGTLRLR